MIGSSLPRANRVAVIGSINMDLVIRVPFLPVPGETVIGESLLTAAGGKGANQAVAARRAGSDVAMIGRVGRDAFGDQLLAGLRSEDIDVSGVGRDRLPTGVALITVDGNGENTIAVASGANRNLLPADLLAGEVALRKSDLCVAQLEIPVETALEAFRRARELGLVTLLNVAPAVPVPPELWTETIVAVLNEGELGLAVGVPEGGTDVDLVDKARVLAARGPQVVIVTRGGDETLVLSADGTLLRVPPPEVQVVDTVGAGDAFVGMLAATYDGQSPDALHRAVAAANAAGALATTRLGAQSSLPSRAEVEALLVRGLPR